MKKPITQVTDHALVRYIERVFCVDVESLRRRIGREVDTGVRLRANGVVKNGVSYKLRGNKVVTVISHKQPATRFRRALRKLPKHDR